MAGTEVYVSVDIEADGPVPGLHSMLSLGAVAYESNDLTEIAAFSGNLHTLPDAAPNAQTMSWWDTQPDAWAEARRDPLPPAEVMANFRDWLEDLQGQPVFVAYPTGFDFGFVQWYLHAFLGTSPFGHHALDMRSYAMGMCSSTYANAGKSNMPPEWFAQRSLTHIAVEDARDQGEWFCAMIRYNRGKKGEIT